MVNQIEVIRPRLYELPYHSFIDLRIPHPEKRRLISGDVRVYDNELPLIERGSIWIHESHPHKIDSQELKRILGDNLFSRVKGLIEIGWIENMMPKPKCIETTLSEEQIIEDFLKCVADYELNK